MLNQQTYAKKDIIIRKKTNVLVTVFSFSRMF